MDIRGNRSADTKWRAAGKCRERLIAGAVMLAGLLLCVGCNAPAEAATQQVLTTIPNILLGAWHRNDHDGRRDCKAYREIKSASDVTEETRGLVGALMITSHLVHAYSEYGEGNFYLVKRVVGLGNQRWNVDALVGIDSMPAEGNDDYKGMFRFSVASGLLSMNEVGTPVGTAPAAVFFRCGKVLRGMYSERGD